MKAYQLDNEKQVEEKANKLREINVEAYLAQMKKA
jgi:phosphoribosylaminoimidazole carboxylase